jgi:hypothetical protein
LVLYIEDLFLTNGEDLIVGCKEDFSSEFKMKEIGLMNYFLALMNYFLVGVGPKVYT